MSYTIKQILGEDILLRYKELAEGIDKAIEYTDGEWTSIQLIEACIKQPSLFHVWEVVKGDEVLAIATTRIITYNNFTALCIVTLGGSELYKEMPALITEFEKVVRKYDQIDYLEYAGRRGFVKQLTKVGWTERYTIMRRNLKEIN